MVPWNNVRIVSLGIDGPDVARRYARQGAVGLIVFAAFHGVGAWHLLHYRRSLFNAQSLGAMSVLVQAATVVSFIPVLLLLAWRTYRGKAWLGASLVLAYYAVEVAAKAVGGAFRRPEIPLVHLAVVLLIAQGARACCWLRRHHAISVRPDDL